MTAAISACILKTLNESDGIKMELKLVSFCVATLILKMEENTQHFWHIMLYYLKKGKNTTGMQKKICVVYEEGIVTD